MKVTSRDEISRYVNQTPLTKTKKFGDKAQKPAEPPLESQGDAICSISQRSKEVQKAHMVMQSEPDVRLGKVQALKEKIDTGAYEIDFDKTAEKMLKAFSDETI